MILQILRKEKYILKKEIYIYIQRKKKLKGDTIESINAVYDDEKMVVNSFKSGKFPLKPAQGTGNSGMLALVACVAERSDRKVSDPLHPSESDKCLKILTPNKCFKDYQQHLHK